MEMRRKRALIQESEAKGGGGQFLRLPLMDSADEGASVLSLMTGEYGEDIGEMVDRAW